MGLGERRGRNGDDGRRGRDVAAQACSRFVERGTRQHERRDLLASLNAFEQLHHRNAGAPNAGISFFARGVSMSARADPISRYRLADIEPARDYPEVMSPRACARKRETT